MQIKVISHSNRWTGAVEDFNQRLAAQGSRWGFYADPTPKWLPPVRGGEVFQEYFLAVDDDIVRGGYALKTQPFVVGNSEALVSAVQGPVTEGTVSRSASVVVLHLLRDMHKRQPMLFGWGMGGRNRVLPQLLSYLGWQTYCYPWCYYLAMNPNNLCRTLPRNVLRLGLLDNAGTYSADRTCAENALVISEFGKWSDSLWDAGSEDYAFVARRTSSILNRLYPANNPKYVRLMICDRSEPIGWAVIVIRQMQADEYFGEARVAYLWDFFAPTQFSHAVIRAALAYASSQCSDLFLACVTHSSWVQAFLRNNFLAFTERERVLGLSPALSDLLKSSNEPLPRTFLCDGDADGPMGFFGKRMGIAPGSEMR